HLVPSRSVKLVVAALALSVVAPARAQDGAELLDRAFRNLYADDYVQQLWLKTRVRGGREMPRQLQITRKQSVRPGKALVRFLQPYAVRHTAILVLENDGASDDQYVFLPASERTLHLTASQRADSFFGTDLAYEDLEPKYASDYEVTAIRSEVFEGIPCQRLEIRPKAHYESSYERMESCVDPVRAVMLWTDFYSRGALRKRLVIDAAGVRPVEERFIPFRMTMSTPRRQSETIILTERYELRPQIPEQLFSIFNLESGDAKRDRQRAAGRGAPDATAVAAGMEERPEDASAPTAPLLEAAGPAPATAGD
ncbi:MAG: outer membrane lipoprotein-sorting protein, partial [Myxococcota bacterium]